MGINLGNIETTDIKFGNTDVEKVYRGTTQVWERSGEPPVPDGYGRIFVKTVPGAPGFEVRCSGDFSVTDSQGKTDYIGSLDYQQILVQSGEFVQMDFVAGVDDSIRFAASTTAWRVYVEEINVISFGDIPVGYEMFRNCRAMKFIKLPAISPAFTSNYRMFQNNYELICITGQIDTRSSASTTDMFTNANSLVTPDSTEQSNLIAGALWTNTEPCY